MFALFGKEQVTVQVLGNDGKPKKEFILPTPDNGRKTKRVSLRGHQVIVEFSELNGSTAVIDKGGATDMSLRSFDTYFTPAETPRLSRIEQWNGQVTVYPTATIGQLKSGPIALEATLKPEVAAGGRGPNFGLKVSQGRVAL